MFICRNAKGVHAYLLKCCRGIFSLFGMLKGYMVRERLGIPDLGIDGTVSASEEFCDQNENLDTRGQAHDVLSTIQRVSVLSFVNFWKEVLTVSWFAAKRFVIGELCPEDESICSLLESGTWCACCTVSDNALKNCEKLEISIEKRRVRMTKRMPGKQNKM